MLGYFGAILGPWEPIKPPYLTACQRWMKCLLLKGQQLHSYYMSSWSRPRGDRIDATGCDAGGVAPNIWLWVAPESLRVPWSPWDRWDPLGAPWEPPGRALLKLV